MAQDPEHRLGDESTVMLAQRAVGPEIRRKHGVGGRVELQHGGQGFSRSIEQLTIP